jgi:dihydrofolate synthase/folylpolyglutamate synthase
MEYREVINYLYDMLPMYQRIGNAAFKKNLSNTRKLCKYLGQPQKKFKSIHVAGTNGKGSSSHMLASILAKAGYKTGLYTSPHLKHFNERIRINGIPVSENYIMDFVEFMKPVINSVRPSFFELTVAMAFDYFAKEKTDFAVIEVGLGGRLDSTNVIKPQVSLITNISFDHMEMLGETLEEIAIEKGGIIKKNVPVIIGENSAATSKVFLDIAGKRNAPIEYASDIYEIKSLRQSEYNLEIEVIAKERDENWKFVLDTPDLTQVKNIPGVLAVVSTMNRMGIELTYEHVSDGLKTYQKDTGLKGRWQIMNVKPLIIADVAHNKAGFESTLKQLLNMKYRNLYFILGFMKEKDLGNILPLFPQNAFYTFCQANVPRAMDAKWLSLKAALFGINGKVIPDVNEALRKAREKAGDKDIIFIGGSTFVVAELKDL